MLAQLKEKGELDAQRPFNNSQGKLANHYQRRQRTRPLVLYPQLHNLLCGLCRCAADRWMEAVPSQCNPIRQDFSGTCMDKASNDGLTMAMLGEEDTGTTDSNNKFFLEHTSTLSLSDGDRSAIRSTRCL